MEWVEDSQATKDILAGISKEVRDEYPPRYGNPHVSDLIYCLTKTWYNRVRPVQVTEKEAALYLVGIGLERALFRPHTLGVSGEVDGVIFNVDFLHLGSFVGEFKSTRFSADKPPAELPQGWQRQILSYLYGKSKVTGTPIDLTPRLAIFHLMGNYKETRRPILKTWRGQATVEEVQENWDWVQSRRAILMFHLKENIPPKQFTFNEEWECEECPYKMFCDAAQIIEKLKEDKDKGG